MFLTVLMKITFANYPLASVSWTCCLCLDFTYYIGMTKDIVVLCVTNIASFTDVRISY